MTRLARLLDVPADPATVDRTWDAVAARLPGRRRRTSVVLGIAAFATAAAVTLLLALSGSAPAPFALAGGATIPAELTGLARFSDGSTVVVARGQLELIESSPGVMHLLLPAGDAQFSIVPGGPRRWTIDAGVAQVEVVGTALRVTRDPASVTVSVSHGVVVVRGDRVPGLVRRVRAGESIVVPAAITAALAPDPRREPASATDTATAAESDTATATDTATAAESDTATATATESDTATATESDTGTDSDAHADAVTATDTVAATVPVSASSSPRSKIAPAEPTTSGAPRTRIAPAEPTTSGAPRTRIAPAEPQTSGAPRTRIAPAEPTTSGAPRTRIAPAEPPSPDLRQLSTQALLARADVLRANGELAAAVDALDHVGDASTDPLIAVARFTRARILLELGRRFEAGIDLRRSIAAGLPPALEARARARLLELEETTR